MSLKIRARLGTAAHFGNPFNSPPRVELAPGMPSDAEKVPYTNLGKPVFLSEAGNENYYRSTSLIRKRLPLGPYGRPMPRALWWS